MNNKYKNRRRHLLTYMRNLSVHDKSTINIKNKAEIFGVKLYRDIDTLSMCRADLNSLENEGYVKRSQYLNGPIKWSILGK